MLCPASAVAFVPDAWWGNGKQMDTLGFEPRAFRMQSGCDATTPCAFELIGSGALWLLQPGKIERLVLRLCPDSAFADLLPMREQTVLGSFA